MSQRTTAPATVPVAPQLRIQLGTRVPSTPGLYLYHPPVHPGEPQSADVHGYSDRRVQLVTIERMGPHLIALLRTIDERTLLNPVAMPVQHLIGLWSPNLLWSINDPDMPDAFRSADA